jgi:hypothetical protein
MSRISRVSTRQFIGSLKSRRLARYNILNLQFRPQSCKDTSKAQPQVSAFQANRYFMNSYRTSILFNTLLASLLTPVLEAQSDDSPYFLGSELVADEAATADLHAYISTPSHAQQPCLNTSCKGVYSIIYCRC